MQPMKMYIDGRLKKRGTMDVDAVERDWRQSMPGDSANPANNAITVERTADSLTIVTDFGRVIVFRF